MNIVHADLKPENIIVDYDEEAQQINSLKIIDFGSSFLLSPDGHTVEFQQEFGSSTPEYLPPEIQSFLAKRFSNERNSRVEDFASVSYAFDIWALGSILVELLSGFPLWLSLKSRVVSLDGRSIINYGLFGVAGRDHSKILRKQLEILGYGFSQMLSTLKKGYDTTGQNMINDKQLIDLMMGLLSMQAQDRISP